MATVVTDAGRAWIIDRLDPATESGVSITAAWMAWGTGAGTAVTSGTAISNESTDEDRVSAVCSQPGAYGGSGIRWVALMTCGGAIAKTITNVGNFTASGHSSGSLAVWSNFTGIELNPGDKIEFTLDMELS